MLAFNKVRNKELTFTELVDDLTVDDCYELTNEMIDRQLEFLTGCLDADVTFVPVDTIANDPYAANPADVHLPWTLGHLIVHVTASAEEAAFLAAEMARGVKREGRSRYETPWEQLTTVEQCRQRLEESRRMRLATLGVWPDEPHLDVVQTFRWVGAPVDAFGRFVMGLWHDADHLEQIEEVVRQAHAVREVGY